MVCRLRFLLFRLFERIWDEERVPNEWLVSINVKLHKKGNLKICDNWSSVTLPNKVMKIFSRRLFNRFQEET